MGNVCKWCGKSVPDDQFKIAKDASGFLIWAGCIWCYTKKQFPEVK